jgi:hypothetical protein
MNANYEMQAVIGSGCFQRLQEVLLMLLVHSFSLPTLWISVHPPAVVLLNQTCASILRGLTCSI